ncbi:right-handed parallel beta-helix repeat-containing protein [Halocola ammonii]
MKKSLLLFTLSLFLFTNVRGDIIYVDADSDANNPDGSSWEEAYQDLPPSAVLEDNDQIWIAEGVYGVAFYNTYENLTYYGGFSGNETFLSQRSPEDHPTVFDGGSLAVRIAFNNTITIDGITFNNMNDYAGFCDDAFMWITENTEADITFENCNFFNLTYDEISLFVGCAGTNSSTVLVSNCEFNNVTAESIQNSLPNVTITGTDFINCSAANPFNAFFRNSTIQNCRVTSCFAWRMANSCNFFGCLFDDNEFDNQNGNNVTGIINSDVVNCTFVDNTCNTSIVRNSDVFNSIFDGNTSGPHKALNVSCTAIHCILQQDHTGSGFGNLDTPAEFVNENAGNYQLTVCSPGVNYSFGIELNEEDLAGNPRTVNDIMDLGCYEVQGDTPSRIYVDMDATGNNDGKSWEDAYTSLFQALNNACHYSEVWVAEGTYLPDDTPFNPNRNLSFVIQPGVEVYGGFDGTETSIVARDFENNTTTLSGAIGLPFNISDNSYHVVEFQGGSHNDTRLDGFRVIAGNANGSSNFEKRGGGLTATFGEGYISNCEFYGNQAENGAAIYLAGNGDLKIVDCNFEQNEASDQGGAIYALPVANLKPEAWIDRCIFKSNTAAEGGAIHTGESELTVSNSLFDENLGTEKADAVYLTESSTITLTNLTIVNHNNTALFHESDILVTNSILWNNDEHMGGAGDSDMLFCTVEGGWNGTGNIDANPQFVDFNNGNYQLQGNSASIDFVDQDAVLGNKDLKKDQRSQNGEADRGAYEFNNPCSLPNDFCSAPTELVFESSTSLVTDLTCATAVSEPTGSCSGDDEASVWYKFTMPVKAITIAIAQYTVADVNLTVFTGSCSNFNQVACVDEGDESSSEFFTVQPLEVNYGQDVYFRVGSSGDLGEVSITLYEAACEIEEIVQGEASACDENDWYSQELIVHHKNAPGIGYLVINNEFFDIEESPQSVVLNYQLANGGTVDAITYFTEGDCFETFEEAFTAPCCKVNDECEDAIPVALDQLIVDDNLCATNNGDFTTPCAINPGQSVWYSFVAPETGEVEIQTLLLNNYTNFFRLRQALFYQGCTSEEFIACSNSSQVNQDEIGNYSGLIPGETYLLRVDGANFQRGQFSLEIIETGESLGCVGDYNNDLVRDTQDLLIFISEYGCQSNCGDFDLDNDSEVSTSDLLTFIGFFGTNCPLD